MAGKETLLISCLFIDERVSVAELVSTWLTCSDVYSIPSGDKGSSHPTPNDYWREKVTAFVFCLRFDEDVVRILSPSDVINSINIQKRNDCRRGKHPLCTCQCLFLIDTSMLICLVRLIEEEKFDQDKERVVCPHDRRLSPLRTLAWIDRQHRQWRWHPSSPQGRKFYDFLTFHCHLSKYEMTWNWQRFRFLQRREMINRNFSFLPSTVSDSFLVRTSEKIEFHSAIRRFSSTSLIEFDRRRDKRCIRLTDSRKRPCWHGSIVFVPKFSMSPLTREKSRWTR